MGKIYDEIDANLAEWIAAQRMFFVATAPLGEDGHVNCSPKGLDTFRVLGPRRVGYLDLTGSGAETIAHLRENGRITFLFYALEGAPKIVRLYGTGRVLTKNSAGWDDARAPFPDLPGARTVISADITRIADSCGYGVPRYEHVDDRDTLVKWVEKRDASDVAAYLNAKNTRSIDDLPALDPTETT